MKEKRKQYKCPECGSRDGIVGHFRKGKTVKKEFIYCDSCKWIYKLEDWQSGNASGC